MFSEPSTNQKARFQTHQHQNVLRTILQSEGVFFWAIHQSECVFQNNPSIRMSVFRAIHQSEGVLSEPSSNQEACFLSHPPIRMRLFRTILRSEWAFSELSANQNVVFLSHPPIRMRVFWAIHQSESVISDYLESSHQCRPQPRWGPGRTVRQTEQSLGSWTVRTSEEVFYHKYQTIFKNRSFLNRCQITTTTTFRNGVILYLAPAQGFSMSVSCQPPCSQKPPEWLTSVHTHSE